MTPTPCGAVHSACSDTQAEHALSSLWLLQVLLLVRLHPLCGVVHGAQPGAGVAPVQGAMRCAVGCTACCLCAVLCCAPGPPGQGTTALHALLDALAASLLLSTFTVPAVHPAVAGARLGARRPLPDAVARGQHAPSHVSWHSRMLASEWYRLWYCLVRLGPWSTCAASGGGALSMGTWECRP